MPEVDLPIIQALSILALLPIATVDLLVVLTLVCPLRLLAVHHGQQIQLIAPCLIIFITVVNQLSGLRFFLIFVPHQF